MPLAGGLRAVIKNMAQVAATAAAMAFGPRVNQFEIPLGADRIRQGLPETGPAGAAVVFVLAGIKRQIAAAAMI